MTTARIRPISSSDFAPFGTLVSIGEGDGGRFDFSNVLENNRLGAKLRVCLVSLKPCELPLEVDRMERHEYSSQTFIPRSCESYVVLVAPPDARGGPDSSQLQAFHVPGNVGINYRANVWHHPMTVLGAPAEFMVIMYADGSDLDEEFVCLAARRSVAPAA
ncbi:MULTISPECIES: ureidoglycolate lyase [Mesorhizobium]|uniref:Ureidoglycolate lyase n=1 Tax=Mesorhizobium qingshengii TaxID=1165689 RepID=A0A1G5ZXV3_9HYPH|nr:MULTISPECIES: ureidoglycolate lyase [Mesorhizobium]MCH4560630.1 ureidoglycolate lyase [Mesorhizobium jarvisii]SDA99113.1 ureidoglycolate lyase [Mesorhizobium qingshengii]